MHPKNHIKFQSPIFPYKYPFEHFFSIQDWLNYYGESFYSKKIKGKSVKPYILKLKKNKKNNANLYLDYKKIKIKDYFKNYSIFREMQRKYLAKQSNKVPIFYATRTHKQMK